MPTVQGTEDVILGPSGYNLNVASTVGFFQPRISNPWPSDARGPLNVASTVGFFQPRISNPWPSDARGPLNVASTVGTF